MAEVESFTLDHTAVKAPYVRLINVEAGPKGDPEDFMRHTSEFVNRSIVLHSQVEVSNGTTVTAWVRRDEDGLFSVLTADGPLDADGQREADALEARVRDAVGLD